MANRILVAYAARAGSTAGVAEAIGHPPVGRAGTPAAHGVAAMPQPE